MALELRESDTPFLLGVAESGAFQLAKDKQKKHEAAEATSASGKMSRKEFEKELAKLQVELVRLQTWVQAKHARVIVVFEGRDTAGKGGVISRITARTSPRASRASTGTWHCPSPPT
jgi:polyphosphate kinase 2 (PPK2 family)